MPEILFGRVEPDGRRHLGSDLALLGKWVEAATLAPPSPQVALSELSKRDQERLFTSPRHDYAFAYQNDGSLKLQEIKAGEARELDHEVRAMMDQAKSKLIQEREAAMRSLLEKHDNNKRIRELDDRGLRNLEEGNDDAFLNYGNTSVWDDQRANRIRRAAGNQHHETTDKYKQEQFTMYERADKHIEMTSLDLVRDSYALSTRLSPRDPSKRPIGTKAEPADGASVYSNFYPPSMAARPTGKGSDNLSSSLDTNFRPNQAKFPSLIPHTAYPFPSYSASPDHGSDTTAFNSSPQYFSDATLPSRRLSQNSDSSVGSVFDSLGGAGLDATAPIFDPTDSSSWAPPRGGLGNGLSEAYRSGDFSTNSLTTPDGFHYQSAPHVPDHSVSLPVQHQVSCTDLVRSFGNPSAAASDLTALYGIPGLPRPVFAHAEASFPAPQPKVPAFSVSNAQPYPGITFYDVSGRRPEDALAPAYWTTKEGKARLLAIKLQKLKLADAEMLKNPATKVPASNIHVFVDLSNIVIGFYDALKRKRGLSAEKRIKAPGFSFDNFHALLARGRKVEKSVVAGSRTTGTQKTPEYMRQAENLGYEMNIMRRIPKQNNCKSEQGVDELLHLKILQCPYDHDAGTIVLATGDAAEAEFSDGFKKNVERVLKCGWNLELYGWSHTMSSAWRDAGFLANRGNRIRIIELDEYIEELYEMTIDML